MSSHNLTCWLVCPLPLSMRGRSSQELFKQLLYHIWQVCSCCKGEMLKLIIPSLLIPCLLRSLDKTKVSEASVE